MFCVQLKTDVKCSLLWSDEVGTKARLFLVCIYSNVLVTNWLSGLYLLDFSQSLLSMD